MIFRSTLILLLLISFFFEMAAQDNVKGKIYDAQTDSTIEGVNVFNLNTKQSTRSGSDGSYTIAASEGDRIMFSRIGFMPDTATVIYSMLLALHDVTLYKEIITLKNVTVTSSYQQDSLSRRNFYSDIYKRQPGITGLNTPQYGFGVSVSPLSYFSYRAKQKRQLKRSLLKQEEESYVDRSFPKEWVSRLTGLRGDSLSRFMMLYRPSYKFCRENNREKMLIYISDKLKEFKKADKPAAMSTLKEAVAV
ncbi:MAG TPA: carboxypeptidase-like regulatory domain-containing protein [Chitinophagaceae bacterium]|nr:carboxypeptidase-like regulatory domain-containing protein [Chitinophagaceae bacterium]